MTGCMKRLLCAVAMVAGATLPAVAQTPVEIGPDDWQVRCEEAGCLVVKPLPVDEAGRRMLLTFAVAQDRSTVRMALITPLGTDLEQGLRLQIGARDTVYRFSTCMGDGCLIVADLSPDDIENISVQPGMTATFYSVGRSEPFIVNIPLADFGEAIALARKGGSE